MNAHDAKPKTNALPGAPAAGLRTGGFSRGLRVAAAAFLLAEIASPARGQDEKAELSTPDTAMRDVAHQSPVKLWTTAGEPTEAIPIGAAVIRSRFIRINPAALADMKQGRPLMFELFDDLTVVGIANQRRERSSKRFILAGRIGAKAGGSFSLAVNGDVLAGIMLMGELGTYRIRFHPSGLHILQQIETGKLLECTTKADRLVAFPNEPAGGAPRGGCDDGSVIDVLVVYTQAARIEAGGVAAIEAEIDLQVAFNNVSYVNSLVSTQWNLVFAWQLGPEHNNLALFQLQDRNDGIADGVHTLRDGYGADLVALVIDGFIGSAFGLLNLDPESEAFGFSLNGRQAFPLVLSHEIGHNMGCGHALGQGGGPPEGGLLFPFSNGHIFTGNSGAMFATVMAGGGLQHFSNPNVLFDGQPTGIPEGAMGHQGAENARTINLSAFTVSNWRCNDGICEGLALPSNGPDCNDNVVPDACDIALGMSLDCNLNSIPDGCEGGCTLLGDVNPDCFVNGEDIAGYVRVQLGLPPEGGENQGCANLAVATFVTILLD